MTNLWHLHPVLRRLEILLKQLFGPRGEIAFRKYEVARRPGAECLRRRLLLRAPDRAAELRLAGSLARSRGGLPSAGNRLGLGRRRDDQSTCPF